MTSPIAWGEIIRTATLQLIIDFMRLKNECAPNGKGLTQTAIFNGCNLQWGEKKNASLTSQQSWFVGALRTLEEKGMIERINDGGPWRFVVGNE